jgi:hypothetical protein
LWNLKHKATNFILKGASDHYIWSTDLYATESWTFRKADQKYLESVEMRCWRRLEKISWTDRVRNEELQSQRGTEYPTYNKKKEGNWIGHILRRNCLLKHVIEGKIEDKKM